MKIPQRIRALPCFIVAIGITLGCVRAQQHDNANLGEVDTLWAGIRLQLLRLEQIPGSRLLAVIRIVATPQAPPSGTLIGTKIEIPAGVSKEDRLSGRFAPRPFSLATSEMIHEQTGRKFPALPPSASAGRTYIPGEVLAMLRPGQAEVLTVQFAMPIEIDMPRQTASFLFTNAKQRIGKVPIPSSQVVNDSMVQKQ